MGTAYLRIEFIGGATITFRMMMDAIMQASGDSVNPMWIAVIYRIFHIILSPFLIFGLWIFPKLGVTGAATTGVIAQSLGVFLGLNVLFGARSRVRLSFKKFSFDFGVVWRIVRIGFPASITGVQRNLNQFFLQIFMAPFGAAALAAHVIVQRLEMFILMPAMSFGQGAGILVGQNWGRSGPKEPRGAHRTGVAVVEIFVSVVAVAMALFALPVVRIFNSDPAMTSTAGPVYAHSCYRVGSDWYPIRSYELSTGGRGYDTNDAHRYLSDVGYHYTGSRTTCQSHHLGSDGNQMGDDCQRDCRSGGQYPLLQNGKMEDMGFHPLGTCRMATSARRGVVDTDHEVFGHPGLFIADGSVVPSSVAVNPQITIMAMATRAAERIAQKLG